MKINKIYQIFKIFFKVFGLNKRIDDYFRLEDFSNSVDKLHFSSLTSSSDGKKLFFRKQVREIELETHAFCNRRCVFCPNASIDRLDKAKVLPEATFKKIIDELSDLGYKGSIRFHRFNEPLGLDIIFDRIKYAREKLPNVLLGFHSNGDYVTSGVIDRLEEIGMNFLHISLYIDYNIPYFKLRKSAVDQSNRYFKKRGLKAIRLKAGENLTRYRIITKKMDVTLFVPNIRLQGNDRGGYLEELHKKKPRVSPCVSPFRGLYIDWTGDVLPCCNLRGDIELQKKFIMGNIKDHSLEEVYFSEASNRIRKMLVGYNEKEDACKYCGYDLFCRGNKLKKLIDRRMESISVKTNL
ncbi:MAG: radical SAM/SPASM domain-containing protein [Candidatus Omnitrophota bacterium]